MKTAPIRKGISLLLAFCMIAGLALGCTACGSTGGGTEDTGGGTGAGASASAASMFLRKTEGTVAVADAEGQDVAPAENLGLYSGYTVGTEAESYAWIDLDKVKLAKLDENSDTAIVKDGKNLTVEVRSGSLFFNVTEPLAEDETMEISTSSMLVGIRGTCGWVEAPESGAMRVFILEGKVECTAGENIATVNAGEMAEMTADGVIEVSVFTAWDVPDFVTEEMKADETLSEAVLAASGIDAAGNPMSDYADVFAGIENRGGAVMFAEEFDFEADGSPELLVIYTNEEGYAFSICRKGTALNEQLYGMRMELNSNVSYRVSLAESGDKLCVLVYREYYNSDGSHGDSYRYIGSVAPNDEDRSIWDIDRVKRHYTSKGSDSYHRAILEESGLRGPDMPSTADVYEAVIAQFTEVRVLLNAGG